MSVRLARWLAAAVAAVAVAAVGAPASAAGPTPVVRLAGSDRIATSIAVLDAVGTGKATASIARSDDFPDALSAPPGPVLLNPTARLDPRVAAALTRDLKAGGTVYLMGTVDVMSTQVAQQVAALGFKAVRLGGADRYATAAASASIVPAVRTEQPEGSIWDPCWFVLARGDDFPDALVARTLADDYTLLLTDGSRMPAVTAATITRRCPSGALYLVTVGGPADAAARAWLAASGRTGTVKSLVGADRYQTAAQVLTERQGFILPVATVATGANWPDALSAGGRRGLIFLADPVTGISQSQLDQANTNGYIGEVDLVGGPDVISDQAGYQLQAVLPTY
jgi:hypothetical protein